MVYVLYIFSLEANTGVVHKLFGKAEFNLRVNLTFYEFKMLGQNSKPGSSY